MNDRCETKAIKIALGEEQARKAMISSTKSMTGHMLGATGAVELIASALALNEGFLPPTIGYKEPDPECDLTISPTRPVRYRPSLHSQARWDLADTTPQLRRAAFKS